MLQIPKLCTGCYACVNICPAKCIFMKENEDGFRYPHINAERCLNCAKCEKICPIYQKQDISDHTVAYALKSKKEDERKQSTSGGVFSLLAGALLDKGGMIFGAVYDDNFMVKHIAVTDRKELFRLRRAKYTQSMIGNTLKQVEEALKSGRPVLFSGTPCQCIGLKAFLGKEYENLLLVDLICHGVPSPRVWQNYIDYRAMKENEGKRPSKINMRSKVSGWSRYGYSCEFDYGEGYITRIHNSQDLFMKAFAENICLRNSCSDCVAKGIERCTDLTLGDYWGVWNQHPEFDDNKGTSIVFVHSPKGRNILKNLSEKMECLEVRVEDAHRENGSLVNSSLPHPDRDKFLAQVTAENFEELLKQYFPEKEEEKAGILHTIKRFFIR